MRPLPFYLIFAFGRKFSLANLHKFDVNPKFKIREI